MTTTSTCYSKSLSQLQRDAANIKRNSKVTSGLLKDVKEKRNNISSEVNDLDIELVKASAALIAVSNQLNNSRSALEQAQASLEETTKKKTKQYEAFKQRLRFIYENGKVAYVHTLLKAHDVNDLIARTEYMNTIVKYDSDLLTSLKKSEEEIAQKIEQIKIEQERITKLVAQESQHKNALEEKVNAKQELIKKLNADASKYEEQLRDLESSSSSIEKLIRESQVQNDNTITYTGGKLGWPLVGHTMVSSGYGRRSSPISGKGEFHTGLDIPAPTGTPVHAAEDGVIINSGPINGYGYTIIIKHDNGLSTLYAHNSQLIAGKGQRVKRGDTVALVGTTGYSTGPHCHFEVRVNGSHTNPWSYLK